MSDTHPSEPLSLLLHDGELADVCDLLRELRAPFVERMGGLLEDDRRRHFQLVVGTPQRLLELGFGPGEQRPMQIAICDSDSRSLRNSLQRASIELMVRRPVHPAALRGLLLRSLYRGPERRRSVRVSVGAPVRFRAGLRRHPAVLADLSTGGFRVLTPNPVDPGKTIHLLVPREVGAGGKAFSVKAKALRQAPGSDGWYVMTAQFCKPSQKQLALLRGTVAAHAKGPATFDPETVEADAPAASQSPVAPQPAPVARPPNGSAAKERRAAPRRQIDRRVIALNEESARVLMGRDISLGGMRVNPSPLLVVGSNVRIAIHIGNQTVPLVVTARVHRDDGERGIVLRFHELDPDCTHRLNAMLDSLPLVDTSASGSSAGMIVSEILAEAG